MPATVRKYRPPHTSEREMTVKNSCRFHALVIVRAIETTGEQLIRKNGKPYSHYGRLKLAKLLRWHAAKVRGEPPLQADGFNRGQALHAYAQVFRTGNAQAADLTPAQMREKLENGWAMTVSGNTDSVPNASKLDDFVNDVPHEIAVLPFPNDFGPLVDEPMRPKGKGLIRVSWKALNRFTSEFKDGAGRRYCIIVKAGWDTAATRRGRLLKDVIDEKDQIIDRVRDARNDAQANERRLSHENSALEFQLAECREDRPDTGGVIDAVEERFADLMAGIKDDYL